MSEPRWIRGITAVLFKIDVWRAQTPWWLSLVVGALSACLGALARVALLGGATTKVAYVTFYPAVMLAALFGGLWGGALAVICAALLAHAVFVPLVDGTDWLALGVFLTSCTFIVGASELLLRSRASVAAAQAAQAAQAVDSRLAALVESSSDAIVGKSLDLTITSWNAGASSLFGYSAEEMIGQKITRLIPPDLLADEERTMARLGAGERIDHYETVRLTRDGREIDVSLTISPVRDASGQVIGASKIARDITARKRSEQGQREGEQRKSFLLELGDALKPLTDPDDIVEAASTVLGRHIGGNQVLYAEMDPTDTFAIISRDWTDGSMASNVGVHRLVDFGPQFIDDLKARKTVVIDDVRADPRTGSPEAQATFKAGNIAAFMCVPLVKNGRLAWVLSVHSHSPRHWSGLDVSLVEEVAERTWAAVERARAEHALRESEAALRENEKNFRLMADEIPHLAWIAHADGYVYWYNQRWYRYTGTAPEQMEGWGWKDVHDPDVLPAVMDRWMASITTGKPFDMTFPLRGADGQFRPFLTRVMPLKDECGKVLQWFGTNTEITQQKAMEEALRHAKSEAERANLAKGKFLAAASHDLRQPVQSLTLLLSVIKRQLPDTPTAAETIQLARASLCSLNGMLTGILDLSRLDAGIVAPNMASVDLGQFVERLAGEYRARAAECDLDLRAAPRALRAKTDAVLLERIVRNLIENALHYTAEGGVLIGLRQRGDRVRLDVVDTGMGIPLGQQTEIFEEFRQLNNPARDSGKGLGLGLAIVARLASLLDAEVQVSSRVGRGSRFSVLLPLDRSAPIDPAAGPEPCESGGRILVIEDNAIVRASYEFMLSDWGYEILSAASGEEALDFGALANWRFDAVLADYRLGPGLTGAAAAAEIARRAGRAVPTMLVTGDTATDRLAEISGSGFALMHKPVNTDDLRRKLAGLLRGE